MDYSGNCKIIQNLIRYYNVVNEDDNWRFYYTIYTSIIENTAPYNVSYASIRTNKYLIK